ncbi:DUF4231 domain-containing protein [Kribbella sp. NPDC051770]|uniref:DUF4231 domain-containing protein n=1 Tax=Kribbella sp. NPDC051770 TaxID=3155413 RepID=UPI003444D8E3
MTRVDKVPDTDMPQLFQAADGASLEAQASYIGRTRLRLVLISVAAACGIASWRVGEGDVDLLGILGTALFIGALVIETSLWRDRPDKVWYDGRAVAESAKTLAWKFAVCGSPFPSTMDEAGAARGLADRLDKVKAQFPDLELHPVAAPLVSPWMLEQRRAPIDDRRYTYLKARIEDQQTWYSRKAKYNKRRSKQWRLLLVILEILGAAASLAGALIDVDLFFAPAIAALVGAVVAWIETKQHDSLSRAYSAATADLASAEAKLNLATTDDSWAIEVDDAEEAISREHTVWLASRSR